MSGTGKMNMTATGPAGSMCPLDDMTETEDFYQRLLKGIRNFTTWQPVFAKLDDAASFAHTLAGYEESAQKAESFWLDWRKRCRSYFTERADLPRERRQFMKDEEEYEHSGLWGRKPVFDFVSRVIIWNSTGKSWKTG